MTSAQPSKANAAPPSDLSHHFSRNAKSRAASSVKQFYKYFSIPGIGQLAGGLPNDHYFPFDTLEAQVARPARFVPTPNKPIDPPPEDDDQQTSAPVKQLSNLTTKSASKPQDTITVPHTSHTPDQLGKIDLQTALQYGTAQGYPPLYGFLRQLTRENLHPNCPYEGGPEIILSCGNTDGFSKVLQLLTDEWSEEKDWIRDRDGLLVERFAYMNALQTAKPRGLNIVPVDIDDEGMIVEGNGGLREVLEGWDSAKGRRPRIMYTVTMGQNPTSGVLSLQRRREIYALACKYDIIIVEDDPYWYLQYPSSTAFNTTNPPASSDPSDQNTSFNPDVRMFANAEPVPENWRSSGYDFLDSLVPSSVSIDTEGRVVRLDTFSKTIAPGCRLGWITAQPAFIERILRITETSTQQPSGFVQAMIAELLLGAAKEDKLSATTKKSKHDKNSSDDSAWKADGWIRWIEGLRGNYERRMGLMSDILNSGRYAVSSTTRHKSSYPAHDDNNDDEAWSLVSKKEILSFIRPVGGMFLWLRIHFENHPLYSHYAKKNSLARFSHALWVFWTTKPYLVLVSPGLMFSPTDAIREAEGWRYFRLCFAAVDDEGLKAASERVRDAVGKFWEIRDVETIERILREDEDEVVMGGRKGEGVVDLGLGPFGC